MHSKTFLLFVIVLATCLTQFAADIYAPSLPAIAAEFTASIALSQWSMVIYLFGVAITLLMYGPLSEGVGRKLPLVIGLIIMVAGSFICLFAPNIYVLIAGRLVQGCGAGACAGLWRSVFRDVFTGNELAKYGSYFTILIMFIVPAAPALGGYLQHYFSWRASFVFMSGYALFALFAILVWYKETNIHHHKDKLHWSYIKPTFLSLMTNPVFMGVTFCTFLSYGAFFAWFTVGPILLIHIVGMSPLNFGLCTFLGGGTAYALAGWINGKVVKRFGMSNMMRLGWAIMLLSGVLMLGGQWLLGTYTWTIMPPIILFYFGSTFIWPNAFATAFTPFGHIAGYAGALYGFMQIAGGAVIGGLVTYLPHINQIPLGIVMLTASLFSWVFYENVVVKALVPI